MSLILDALKKLDREKSFRRRGSGNIAAGILKPDPPRQGKRTLRYVSAFCLTALAAGAITYAVLQSGFPARGTPPSPVNPPAPAQPAAPVPSSRPAAGNALDEKSPVSPMPRERFEGKIAAISPAEKKTSRVAPGPLPQKTVREAQDEISRAAPQPQLQAEAKTPAIPRADEKMTSAQPRPLPPEPVGSAREEKSRVAPKPQHQPESKPPATPVEEKKPSQSPQLVPEEAIAAPGSSPKPPEHTPGASAATPPSLKISGIVWNEEPSERRVVINGTVFLEGALVEGAKIVEIQPTRVRFLQNGRSFEISIFE